MGFFHDRLPHLVREPYAPPELRDAFKLEVAFSNSRRLKPITWLLLSSLVVYMFADYLTVERAGTPQAHAIWNGILIMRPVAMIACGIFLWLFGPLKTINDIKPRHYWLWKVYIYFFLVYTSIIVAYMFPLKESIGPIYIFLLGPSAFIAMTTLQTTIMLTLGMVTITSALLYFVPEALTVKYQLINAMIISWVSFVVAHVTYASTFRDFMNKQLIEKQNWQLKEATATAKAANRAKSDFLAAISHEIRTPMNAILGMTEITLRTPLNNDQRDYLETAREAALHLLDIINDILDFSRMEARRLRLISAHFDLPAVMHSAVKTVRLQAEQKGLALDLEILSDTPRFLKGDPGRLRQVLINLLNNAIIFTESGSIRVTVGPLRQETISNDETIGIRFSIKDTGIGVPEEKIHTIFKAFTQADGSSSRTYGGSGLGLAICKYLVTLMGGTIFLESRLGKGSEVTFTAHFGKGDPKRATEIDMLGAAIHQQLPIKPSRILLVDDNPHNVKVLQLHLDRMDMQTTVAESGTEALIRLAEEDFDLVLMDLEMPGMDGYETTQRIRNGEGAGRPVRQPDIPILAVTAHVLADVRERCTTIGMNGFVTKPLSFGDLGAAMRQILGGNWQEATGLNKPEQESAAVLDLIYASKNLGVSQAEIRHLIPNAIAEIDLKFDLADRAVNSKTLREATLQAHTLKSVAASIGAEATRRAAVKLENAARREELELTRIRLTELRTAVSRLHQAVADL